MLAGDVGRQAVFNGSDARVLHARQNLEALVREVRSFDPSGKPLLNEANLFLIPASGAASAASAPYDFQLSDAYRRAFAALVATRPELAGRLGRPGPFLIATRMPLNELIRFSHQSNPPAGVNTNIVLIDLVDAEPRSVVVFVSIFKDAIRRDDVVADKQLAPLRAIIVSGLVRVNEAIPFIGGAYAGVKEDKEGATKAPGRANAGGHRPNRAARQTAPRDFRCSLYPAARWLGRLPAPNSALSDRADVPQRVQR